MQGGSVQSLVRKCAKSTNMPYDGFKVIWSQRENDTLAQHEILNLRFRKDAVKKALRSSLRIFTSFFRYS